MRREHRELQQQKLNEQKQQIALFIFVLSVLFSRRFELFADLFLYLFLFLLLRIEFPPDFFHAFSVHAQV